MSDAADDAVNAVPPHIVIAGGGMVGLSLALLLDRRLPESARITLVEKFSLSASGTPGESRGSYHPSFDARSTALSYSTALIYRDLGLWPALEQGLGAIRSIHVSRRGRFGSSVLEAGEQGWEALGWVVENPCLGRVLLDAVAARPRIELRCPDQILDARPCPGGMQVQTGEERLSADLLVIADGAESQLREKLGFFTRRKRYGQRALVANVEFERPHDGRAYERFTAEGPLALLPLPGLPDAPQRMALVWSLAPEESIALKDADEHSFGRALLDAFGQRLGAVRRVGERHVYPLQLTEAVEQVRRGCVLLGNAAHALHPVAGQGFNLALRDASMLAGHLASALRRGRAVGETSVLEDYARRRSEDQARTIAASDTLPGLFMSPNPVLSIGRDLALSAMDLAPALRRGFVDTAAGVSALESGHG